MSKVLVVEDDNNLREIYETSLKAEGYDTSSAADGMEALEVAARDKPDLIISDVMMPRLSGFEMLEKMRQDEALKSIPVIMMTALSMAEDKETAKRLGVVHYLVKSQVTLEDFVNVAKKFVAPDAASGSAAAAPTADPAPVVAPADDKPAAEKPEETEPSKVEPAPEPATTTPATPEPSSPTQSQSTDDATNAVEAQIQDFVDNKAADTTAPEPATTTPATPEPSPSKEASNSDSKKVIEPIADPNKKDIHELAKAEEAKEKADEPVKNPSAGSSIDPNSVAL